MIGFSSTLPASIIHLPSTPSSVAWPPPPPQQVAAPWQTACVRRSCVGRRGWYQATLVPTGGSSRAPAPCAIARTPPHSRRWSAASSSTKTTCQRRQLESEATDTARRRQARHCTCRHGLVGQRTRRDAGCSNIDHHLQVSEYPTSDCLHVI